MEKADVVSTAKKRLAEFPLRAAPSKPGLVTLTDRERFETLGYVGVPGAAVGAAEDRLLPADEVQFVEDYRAAVTLAHQNDSKGALDAFRVLTRQHPQMADLWLHFARTAARGERQEMALEAYRSALELEPGNVSAHLGAATSSLRARRLDEATVHAQWVIDDTSTDAVQKAEAHELLARVALNRKDVDLAMSEADTAESLDPRRPVVSFVDGRVALDQALR